MNETIDLLIKKYGGIAIAGLIGAVVRRFRKYMSWWRFAATIGTSIFISVITGIFFREWTDWSDAAIFGACGIAGVFSDEILDEIQETIKEIPNLFKSWFKSKTNIKDESDDEN